MFSDGETDNDTKKTQTCEIDIAGIRRSLPIYRDGDGLYTGAFTLFGDVELTVHCAKMLLEKAPAYDYIIGPEAKSIPLVYEMARQSGADTYFIARKDPKLYMTDVFEIEVRSAGAGKAQRLVVDAADAELMRSRRILIVDDVVSSGGSMRALELLVEKTGGIIAGRMTVLAEGDACDRDDILCLASLPPLEPDGKPK